MIAMLEICFLNVGDGDAILLRELADGKEVFSVLVDAGRPFLEPANGSLRKEAYDHLRGLGVTKLDLMILTHLHIDHIGGAQRILREIPVKELAVLTLPPRDAGYVQPDLHSTDKTTNGLRMMLNLFRETMGAAERTGCRVRTLPEGRVKLTDRLMMTVCHPRAEVKERQKAVFDDLYLGKAVDYDLLYKTAKERNISSLMTQFDYAGRSVLLTGDRFGADWEEERKEPCDVLKLPHHGDGKSMTPALLQTLSPKIAVISCQNDPNPQKKRPEEETAASLIKCVPKVFCTENRQLKAMDASTHNLIRVTIDDDGGMSCRAED